MNEFLSSSHRPGRTLNPRRRRAHRRPEFESCEPRTLLAVSISDVSLLEGNSGTTAFVFTLSLDAPDMYGFTLEVSTRDGTANAGEDYIALSLEPVNFGPGQLTATVTVDVIGDLIREPNEFFFLDIDTSTSYPITDGEGLGTIQNDDYEADLSLNHFPLPPSVLVCDNFFATIELTNYGPDPATNVVITDIIPSNTAYIDATLSPMIPGSNIQFVNDRVIVTIPTLDVGQSVILDIQLQPTSPGAADNEARVTSNETDPNPSDNTVFESTTIIDPGVLGFEFTSYIVQEDAGFATITVERTGGGEGFVSVFYSTAPGTAVPGVDYLPVTGTLDFADGEFFQSFDIPILSDPAILPDRTVELYLSMSTACPGGVEDAVLTIRESDFLTVSIEDVAVTEGEGVVAMFPVILSQPSTLRLEFIVEFATSNGTATAGVDYVASSGYVEFLPQSLVQFIPITILDDLQLEGPETFFVTLTQVLVYSDDPPGYFPTDRVIIARATATGTIRDDDSLVVTNTNDSGRGSLRRAIQVANANPGTNRVTFNIPGSGALTIQPLSPLPDLFDPVIIDAYSQPGSRQNSQAIGSDAVIRVELSGTQLQGDASGLVVTAGASTIQGLAIGGFPTAGILLVGPGNNTIQGNYLGTDATGTQARPNAYDGLSLVNTSDNLIGGNTPAARNLISGNASTGIQILGNFPIESDGVVFQADSSRNLVLGNYIGTDATGTRPLGNSLAGIFVNNASANVIGAGNPQTRNVISGNAGVGVQLYLAGATANVVQGNFIGTDATGTARLGNVLDGIFINQAPANLIGGSAPGQGNLISANGSVGLQVLGAGATGNVVQGNLVGTTASGLAPLGNLADGVFLNGSAGTLLGGPDPASANVIAANRFSGVHLAAGASANVLQRNLIGIGLDQATPLGNAGYGVSLNDSSGNTIGSTDGPNTIAFNRFGGIATFLGTRQLINQAQGGNTIGPNTLINNGLYAAPPAPTPAPLSRPNGRARAVRAWNRSPQQQPVARLRPRPAVAKPTTSITTKKTTPAQASLRRQVSPQAGVFRARFARFR